MNNMPLYKFKHTERDKEIDKERERERGSDHSSSSEFRLHYFTAS